MSDDQFEMEQWQFGEVEQASQARSGVEHNGFLLLGSPLNSPTLLSKFYVNLATDVYLDVR